MDNSNSKRRVVITGMGVVHPLGLGVEPFWESLLAGKSGISRVSRFDTSQYTCQIGAEIKDFDPSRFMDAKDARRNDRFTHYGMAAAKLAIEDGVLDPTSVDPERFGIIIGSGIGGMETLEGQSLKLHQQGPRKVSPFTIPALISNICSGIVAIELGARGPNFGMVSACATATHSIGEALRAIRYGDADIMLAGGSEGSITPLSYAGFCSMKAMSTTRNDEPERASRPFDSDRDGFVMGEGAGVVILETLEHAQARGAKIYCELAGYGATCDAFHITSPDPEGKGLSLCMRRALSDAGEAPEAVDYINAHGTSTPYNDKFETLSIKKVFGDHANKLKISSTKSMTGHLLGAAGGIEAATSVKAIVTGEIPPTINYETPDPDCDLDYVPNVKASADIRVAMSNNLGFGGQNGCLVFRKV